MLKLWTDGGAYGADRHPDQPGAWAWIAESKGTERHANAGAETFATVSRMELLAVVEGLRWAHDHYPTTPLLVCSDSLGTIRVADGSLSPSDDYRLWEDFFYLRSLHHAGISFAWVKSHNGEVFNERADTMVRRSRAKLVHRLQQARAEGAYI
jgi:ribonuclease HI